MRTTIAIDDHLLRSAKRQAQRRGLTLGQLVEDALRRELSSRPNPASAPEIPVFRGGNGVRLGVDVSSTRGLLEALDEGQGVERTR
jgi:hypothetical protein